MPFVKLDCGILDSSVWVDRPQRDLFITALLMAQPYELDEETPQYHVRELTLTGFVVPPGWYGMVSAAGVGILRRAGYGPDETEIGLRALERLGMPDDESRSSDHEGRRVVRVEHGYLVLGFMRYRDLDHGAKDRMRVLRQRRKSETVTAVFGERSGVLRRTVTEADTEAEAVTQSSGSSNSSIHLKSSKQEKFCVVGSQTEPTPPPSSPPPPERKVAGHIPVIGGRGEKRPNGEPAPDEPVYQDEIEAWQRTFPAIDVRQEVVEFKSWCVNNPDRRKTRKGVRSAINRWLSN
jgi:hypothetical protein